MQPIFFTAGPSQLHTQYLEFHTQAMALNIGSANHRGQMFRDIYAETDKQLRQLLKVPNTHQIYFTGSASEIWERLLLNTVEVYSHHLVNGSFSKRFYEYALSIGKIAKATTYMHGTGYVGETIELHEMTEMICTTTNETSSGVFMPSSALQSLKIQAPEALICSDLVSIAPINENDFTILDSVFFSVQKAFGMPPGLGVWIANNNCLEKNKTMQQYKINMGAHHTLEAFYNNYIKWETPSTPNVVAIYIIGKIAESFNTIGINNIRKDITTKAAMVYNFANASNHFKPLVTDATIQSPSVIVLQCKHKPSAEVISTLKQKNLHISSGYGTLKNEEIRIANFPTTTIAQMQLLLQELSTLDK